VPDLPPEPAGEDLPALVAALRAANARLREVIEAKDAQLAAATAALEAAQARFAALSERVAELERRLGKDSSTSSKPPSSDGPYKSPGTGRCASGAGGAGGSSRARSHRRCARWPAPMTRWCAPRRRAGGAALAWPGRG
jgi:Tfp pilus assembly protein FimV